MTDEKTRSIPWRYRHDGDIEQRQCVYHWQRGQRGSEIHSQRFDDRHGHGLRGEIE